MRAAGDCTRCIASREAGHSRKVARRGGAGPHLAAASRPRTPGDIRCSVPYYARNEGYDEQAMPQLDSEALDFRAASELFAPVRW
jgi:hypothetical protein